MEEKAGGRYRTIHLRGKELEVLISESASEVSGAVLTAMATTIVSFLPIFAMEAQEGKMFQPLAFTKTFALLSALVLGYVVLPTLAYWVFSVPRPQRWAKRILGRKDGTEKYNEKKYHIGKLKFTANHLLIGVIVSPRIGCPLAPTTASLPTICLSSSSSEPCWVCCGCSNTTTKGCCAGCSSIVGSS